MVSKKLDSDVCYKVFAFHFTEQATKTAFPIASVTIIMKL